MHKLTNLRHMFIILLVSILFCHCAFSTPMLYKRNGQEKYEVDLVAVSSTVIPLTVLEVSYGTGGKPSEEYKAAYLRKLRKRIQQQVNFAKINETADANINIMDYFNSNTNLDENNVLEQPDVLITVKSKHIGINSQPNA